MPVPELLYTTLGLYEHKTENRGDVRAFHFRLFAISFLSRLKKKIIPGNKKTVPIDIEMQRKGS